MRIIPVIDLLDGQVVHARRGLRADYRPIVSRLAPDPAPIAVLDAYLRLHPFTTVYVADLNAIQGRGDNDSAMREMTRRHPHLEFWLDAGPGTRERAVERVRPVLGSENGITPSALSDRGGRRDNAILSLDFRQSGLLGAEELLQCSELWPEDVIVLPLDRVGSNDGPATNLCREIRDRCAAHTRLYLGGGVRGAADLELAAQAGAAGVLVATALHSGALDPAALPSIVAR